MALTELDPDKAVEYIPLFDRKNTENPLIIHIKYTSSKVYEGFLNDLAREAKTATNEESRVKINMAHDRSVFLKQVVKVENFLDSEGKEIKDVGRFYDAIDFHLKNEILETMISMGRLEEGQRKN
jgi:hypothetical protein